MDTVVASNFFIQKGSQPPELLTIEPDSIDATDPNNVQVTVVWDGALSLSPNGLDNGQFNIKVQGIADQAAVPNVMPLTTLDYFDVNTPLLANLTYADLTAQHISIQIYGGQSNMVGTNGGSIDAAFDIWANSNLQASKASVKVAVSGTGVSSSNSSPSRWAKTGDLTAQLITDINAAIAAARVSNPDTNIFAGIVRWMQGEQDGINATVASFYYDRLRQTIQHVNRQVGMQMTWIIGRLSNAQTAVTAVSAIQAAQDKLAADFDYIKVINLDDLTVASGHVASDNLHYLPLGYAEIELRMRNLIDAQGIVRSLNNMPVQPPEPTQPTPVPLTFAVPLPANMTVDGTNLTTTTPSLTTGFALANESIPAGASDAWVTWDVGAAGRAIIVSLNTAPTAIVYTNPSNKYLAYVNNNNLRAGRNGSSLSEGIVASLVTNDDRFRLGRIAGQIQLQRSTDLGESWAVSYVFGADAAQLYPIVTLGSATLVNPTLTTS
ncbi:MAG: sialate O-acetylesterase [Marinagarivorans sp.]|nr:sialate O-acetylesterase [Marinagarivorans sp.]